MPLYIRKYYRLLSIINDNSDHSRYVNFYLKILESTKTSTKKQRLKSLSMTRSAKVIVDEQNTCSLRSTPGT